MVFSQAGQSLLDLVHVRTQGFQGFRGFQGIEDGMVPPGIIILTGSAGLFFGSRDGSHGSTPTIIWG